MYSELKTTDSQYFYRGSIFSVRRDRLQQTGTGGKIFWRDVVEHPGAAAILARERDQVVLVKQYRHPASGMLWEIPAGLLEPGEEPLDCARRELAEETGMRGNEWRLIAKFYTSPGFCNEMIYLFEARGLEIAAAAPDEDEQLEVKKIALSTALEMILKGEIIDGKTITALSLILAHPIPA